MRWCLFSAVLNVISNEEAQGRPETLSMVFVLSQGFLAPFDVLPGSTTHGVFPRKNESSDIPPKVMLLPLNLQFHLRRSLAPDLYLGPLSQAATLHRSINDFGPAYLLPRCL